MPQRGFGDEAQRVIPEASAEFLAAIVRHGRDLEDDAARAHAAADGEIRRGEIQFKNQVVPEQREWLRVRNQFRHVALHDGELRFRLSFGLASPGIAGETCLHTRVNVFGRLAKTTVTFPQQEHDPA